MRLVAGALVALAFVAPTPAHAAETPLVVRASLAPSVLFGDRVEARVTVAANPDAVDVSSIRVTAPLVPFTQLGPMRSSHVSQGPVEVVSFRVTASCLEQRCVQAQGPHVLQLPMARVSARATDGRELTASASWPAVTVRGRVPASARDSTGQFRTDLDPPPVTYRLSPGPASTALFLAAAALALVALAVAGILTVRFVRRRNDVPLSELERALLLARQSERRPAPDRRRAVGLLARVLHTEEPPLAERASTLAWSAREPASDSVSTLVDDVGRAVGAQ